MDLTNIEEKIESLDQQYFLYNKAQKRVAAIHKSLELLYNDLEEHRKKMDKEHADVVKLEKMSKRLLFAKILGDQSQQLERERQEYLQAVLEYNSIADEIDLLEFEQSVLESKVVDIAQIKKDRDYYIKLKEQKMMFHKGALPKRAKELNLELDKLYGFKREIKEATEVALQVEKLIIVARKDLERVERFGYQEMYGSGSYSSYAKKRYIDKAIKGAMKINYALNKLDKELSDIYSQYVFLSIYKYQNFIDSFYDHLITDWVLVSKLSNAMSALVTAENQIKRIMATLNNDLHRSNEKVQELVEEKRNVIKDA